MSQTISNKIPKSLTHVDYLLQMKEELKKSPIGKSYEVHWAMYKATDYLHKSIATETTPGSDIEKSARFQNLGDISCNIELWVREMIGYNKSLLDWLYDRGIIPTTAFLSNEQELMLRETLLAWLDWMINYCKEEEARGTQTTYS